LPLNPSLFIPHVIMSEIIIKAEKLGKKYVIGHKTGKTFADLI
jgi:hypothetical protein